MPQYMIHTTSTNQLPSTNMAERVKKILDDKYEAADLELVATAQTHLQAEQQRKLLSLLSKYETLFDGTLVQTDG